MRSLVSERKCATLSGHVKVKGEGQGQNEEDSGHFKFYLAGEKVFEEKDRKELLNAQFKILILDERVHKKVWAADFDIRGIQDQMKEVELGIPKTLKWFLENLTTPVLLLDSCSSDKASLLLPMTMGPLKFNLRVPPSGYLERCSFNTSDCTFTILSFLDHVFESPWRLTHSMHLHSTASLGKKAKDEVQEYQSQQRERDSAAAAAAAAADDDDDNDHNDGDGDDGGGTRNEGRKRKTYFDKNHITVKTSSTSKPELMPMSGKAMANKAKSSVGGAKIVSKKKRRR